MSYISPLNITEDALVAALATEADLSTFNINKGASNAELKLPSIIVSCESASYPSAIPAGYGNYMCKVSVGIFNNVDDDTQDKHREAAQNVLGVLNNLVAVKAAYEDGGDAFCYDTTITGVDEGRGDRAWITTINVDVLIVVNPI
jgi:hypothetical protein